MAGGRLAAWHCVAFAFISSLGASAHFWHFTLQYIFSIAAWHTFKVTLSTRYRIGFDGNSPRSVNACVKNLSLPAWKCWNYKYYKYYSPDSFSVLRIVGNWLYTSTTSRASPVFGHPDLCLWSDCALLSLYIYHITMLSGGGVKGQWRLIV